MSRFGYLIGLGRDYDAKWFVQIDMVHHLRRGRVVQAMSVIMFVLLVLDPECVVCVGI